MRLQSERRDAAQAPAVPWLLPFYPGGTRAEPGLPDVMLGEQRAMRSTAPESPIAHP